MSKTIKKLNNNELLKIENVMYKFFITNQLEQSMLQGITKLVLSNMKTEGIEYNTIKTIGIDMGLNNTELRNLYDYQYKLYTQKTLTTYLRECPQLEVERATIINFCDQIKHIIKYQCDKIQVKTLEELNREKQQKREEQLQKENDDLDCMDI